MSKNPYNKDEGDKEHEDDSESDSESETENYLIENNFVLFCLSQKEIQQFVQQESRCLKRYNII